MAQHLADFQIHRCVIEYKCRPVFYAVSNVASYSSAIGVVSLAVAQDVPGSTVARARRVNRVLVTYAVRKESPAFLALMASRDCPDKRVKLVPTVSPETMDCPERLGPKAIRAETGCPV